jgi:hypothetical protein
MLKRILSLTIIILIAVFQIKCTPTTYLYVSPEGNNINTGSKKSPFQTIQKALDVLEELAGKESVTIEILDGAYYLNEPLKILPIHSGTEKHPVIIQGAEGERIIIIGGLAPIPQWKSYNDQIYFTEVPVKFDQLFVNDKLQHMARYPNYQEDVDCYNGYAADAISPERVSSWKNPIGGFMHVLHRGRWGGYSYQIKGKDVNGELILEGGWQNNRQMGIHPSIRYVENIFEELDAPGEWFLDEKLLRLYYWPDKDVDLTEASIRVANLSHIIEINGAENNPVHDLSILNLEIIGSKRTFMDTREPLLRSDWTIYRGGVILINGGERITIRNIKMNSPGGNGIFINNYNRHVRIENCHIFDAGASGIAFVGNPECVRSPLFEYHETQMLEDMDHELGPKCNDYPANCVAYGNLIERTGRFEKHSAGIQIAMASKIVIEHNSVYDVPRAGINIGDGNWGGHIIAYNDVFNTVLETGDHGTINTWGRDRFWHKDRQVTLDWVDQFPDMPRWDNLKITKIHNNRFRCDHGWDIDLDDGSSNYEVFNNLCLNGGIKIREGYNRTVYNNIMINNGFRAMIYYENNPADRFERNIVCTDYQSKKIIESPVIADNNFHHRPGTSGPAEVLQSTSRMDNNSRQGDAQFVDPLSGDYRVKGKSAALTLGFRNFPMDEFGVVDPELKKIAQTPVFPELHDYENSSLEKDEEIIWYGSTIKNLQTDGDLSATGFGERRGVYFITIPESSTLSQSGLLENDLILELSGESPGEWVRMNNINSFLLIQKMIPYRHRWNAKVWRYQEEIVLKIDLP